jgi:hypothetical protein
VRAVPVSYPAFVPPREAAPTALRLVRTLAVLVGIAVLASIATPTTDGVLVLGRRLPDVCPWAAIGLHCPGCGTTRATLFLLRGDVGLAWRLQPAVFPLVGLALARLLPGAAGRACARGLVAVLLALCAAHLAEPALLGSP